MVAVLTSLRAPSGTVNDVYQPSSGTLYRISRVYSSTSGLYDWRAEKNPGILTSNWSPATTGVIAHGLTSGNVGYPLVNISGNVYLYNEANLFHIFKLCGLVGEIWNENQFSMIPRGVTCTISQDLLQKPSSSGVGPKYYYWDSSQNKFKYEKPTTNYYPIQDVLEIQKFNNNNTVEVRLRSPASQPVFDYRRPLYIHNQSSPSTTWTINHPYHRPPFFISLSVSGQVYRQYTVASSPEFQTVLNLSGAYTGTATLEFYPFNVQPTGYDQDGYAFPGESYPYESELDRFFNL